MKPTKKEIEAAKIAAKKSNKAVKTNEVKLTHLDEIWDTIDELQKNLDFLNDKVQRILGRMGME